MSKIFGGTDDSQQRFQQRDNQVSRDFIEQQMGLAQGDISQGQDTLRGGYGAAYDLMGKSIPQQIDAFQQGNVAAQGYLLGGMQPFQNAVMGGPMIMGQQPQMQPFQMQAPPVFAQQPMFQQPQQMPQQQMPAQIMRQPQPNPLAGEQRPMMPPRLGRPGLQNRQGY